MSEFNKITNILKELRCSHYGLDRKNFSIANTRKVVDTYYSTKELVAIKNELNSNHINYKIDGDINIQLECKNESA